MTGGADRDTRFPGQTAFKSNPDPGKVRPLSIMSHHFAMQSITSGVGAARPDNRRSTALDFWSSKISILWGVSGCPAERRLMGRLDDEAVRTGSPRVGTAMNCGTEGGDRRPVWRANWLPPGRFPRGYGRLSGRLFSPSLEAGGGRRTDAKPFVLYLSTL